MALFTLLSKEKVISDPVKKNPKVQDIYAS